MTSTGPPLTVRTLVGHRWSKVGRFALQKLREAVGEPLRLVVHTDGTLTPALREDYEAWAGPIVWEEGPATEAAVAEALRGHPRCAAYRARHPLARKLFDIILRADEEEVVYMDSDVRWLRRCGGWLREPLPSGVAGRFSSQPSGDEGLAALPRDLAPWGKLSLGARLNTGLLRVRRSLLDLDRVEAMLAILEQRPRAHRREFWLEQTLWAGLSMTAPCQRWDFGAITIPPNDQTLSVPEAGVSAVHCVGPVRLAFWRYKQWPLGEELRPAVEPVKPVSAWSLLASDLRRRPVGAPAED